MAHVPVGTVQINRATVRRSDDPRLRFELRPGGVAQAEVEYRVNALGLRGPETTLEKPPGVRRVAVLGDSIAFGYWVADERGFARQLEAELRAVPGGGRIEVLNFGVPGYNLEQEIETLRTKALAFAPDLVVVLFCLNDLEGLFSYELGLVQERTERRKSPLGRVREWLVGRSRLFAWVEYRLTELDGAPQLRQGEEPARGAALRRGAQRAEEGARGPARGAPRARRLARHPRDDRGGARPGRALRPLPAPRAAPGRGGGGRGGVARGRGPARLLLGLRLPRPARRRGAPEPARPPCGRACRQGRALRARLAVRERRARPVLPRLPAVGLPGDARLLTSGGGLPERRSVAF